jgi:hypothetical protein
MELDGETNLKPRRALETTNILADDIDQLSDFNGRNSMIKMHITVFISLFFSGN